MNNEEIIQKLSEYFKVKPKEIKNIYDNVYEINDKEYLVFDSYDKAYDAAIENCKNILEDVGIDCVDGYENFIDENYFDEMQEEYYKTYCNDIKEEYDSTFKNRLIEECYEHSIISDDDFETDEYDEYEIDYASCLVDEDKMINDYVDYLCRQESSIDWVKEAYTIKDIQKYFPNAFDINEIAEYCVKVDGIVHNLSTYDGKQIQYKGLYLYRIN